MKVNFSGDRFRFSRINSERDVRPKEVSSSWYKVIQLVSDPEVRPTKSGPAWIPAVFSGKRLDENVVKITAFFCDFDNKNGNRVRDPTIRRCLKGVKYVAHTSFSHSKVREKWRVVIPLAEELSRHHYYWLFLYFQRVFSGELDESKKSPSQLYFLPTTRNKADYRWHEGTGKLFKFSDTDLPLRWPQVFSEDEAIQERWNGEMRGLRDKSRSALSHSFISLLAKRGFTKDEIKAIMDYWPHGRARDRDLNYSLKKVQAQEIDVSIVSIHSVERRKVDWLWYPYIPLGKITLLSGDPAVGKSYVGLSIATHLSRSIPLPGAKHGIRGNSLIVSAEDDLSDTIAPRLDAMDADDSKIKALQGNFVFGEAGFETFNNVLETHAPSFIFIDPLSAFIDGETDTNKENAVRALLVRLQHLAEKHHCAIMIIRHFTKGVRDKAIYRGQGSIAFTAAVRSELMAGWVDDQRILAHAKHNVGPRGATLGYDLEMTDQSVPRLVWKGEMDLDVEDLNKLPEKDDKKQSDKAVDFLKDILSDGPVEADKISELADSEKISERTLKRAKASLGVESKRRPDGKWLWELPSKGAKRAS